VTTSKKIVRSHVPIRDYSRTENTAVAAISLMFSGEEGVGRYLDVYAHHSAYNNLKDIGKRLSYIHYLDKLLAAATGLVHADVSKEVRLTKDYET
jgi:splicing factor 3A subunit 3